jgi:hypothetical protein
VCWEVVVRYKELIAFLVENGALTLKIYKLYSVGVMFPVSMFRFAFLRWHQDLFCRFLVAV